MKSKIMLFGDSGPILGDQKSWKMMTFQQRQNVDLDMVYTANLSFKGSTNRKKTDLNILKINQKSSVPTNAKIIQKMPRCQKAKNAYMAKYDSIDRNAPPMQHTCGPLAANII